MILISGAKGFVGNHLLHYLSKSGEKIRALYHYSEPTSEDRQLKNVEWIQCDLLDILETEAAMKNVSQVYHCAAKVSFSDADKSSIIHCNQESTANLVNAALEQNIDKLIFVSSIATLGRAEPGKILSEETFWEESKHNTAYARSKFLAEMEVWRGMAEGLNAAIVNPGIILGCGSWDKGSSGLLKIADKEFPFYTEGINGWVDVNDVVRAMHTLMLSDIRNERFILVEDNYAYKDIFTMMAEALGKKAPHIATPKWASELLWRWQALVQKTGGKQATVSKETARTAQLKCIYDSSKFLKTYPEFRYTPVRETIGRMAFEYRKQTN